MAGDDDALPIQSDARVLGATLKAGQALRYALGADRLGYLVLAAGTIEVNGVRLDARDGGAIRDEAFIDVVAMEDAELVLVDTAA